MDTSDLDDVVALRARIDELEGQVEALIADLDDATDKLDEITADRDAMVVCIDKLLAITQPPNPVKHDPPQLPEN